MAFNISYVYQAVDKFTPVANKVKRSVDSIKQRFNRAGISVKKFGKNLQGLGRNMALKVTAPLALLGGLALRASANMETLRISLESMTGSSEAAEKTLRSIVAFTAETPFQLEGVGKAAKQLLSFGVSQDQLIGKLRFLGDIAAGANVPLTDMAAIFGKSKAKGKAMTEELLQLSDRGIPIIATLAKGLGISKEKIFDLASKGKISFEILQKAMIKMTQKGGIFFEQTKKQSGTLAGIFSTLKDNINISLAHIGDQLVETFNLKEVLKDTIAFIQQITLKVRDFIKVHPGLSKTIIIVLALVAALAPLLLIVGTISVAVVGLGAAAGVAATGISAMLGPIGLLIAGLTIASGLILKVRGDMDQLQAGEATRSRIQQDIDFQNRQSAIRAAAGGVASQGGGKMRLDGNININAPKGAVSSVDTKTSGGGNLGLNMAGAM
jgi:tape measure domain-containing protein